MLGDMVTFVKFLLSIVRVGAWEEGVEGSWGVGELRAIDIPDFTDDNLHR